VPIGFEHSAHVDCRQGVLPFTRMNLIGCLLIRSAWRASPTGDKTAPQKELA
jgi:hypothetical protein